MRWKEGEDGKRRGEDGKSESGMREGKNWKGIGDGGVRND